MAIFYISDPLTKATAREYRRTPEQLKLRYDAAPTEIKEALRDPTATVSVDFFDGWPRLCRLDIKSFDDEAIIKAAVLAYLERNALMVTLDHP